MKPVHVRKEAARRLALEMHKRMNALVTADANDPEAINMAAVNLGSLFNDNIEFVINVLRDYGGMQAAFDPIVPPKHDPLPATPAIFAAGPRPTLKHKP